MILNTSQRRCRGCRYSGAPQPFCNGGAFRPDIPSRVCGRHSGPFRDAQPPARGPPFVVEKRSPDSIFGARCKGIGQNGQEPQEIRFPAQGSAPSPRVSVELRRHPDPVVRNRDTGYVGRIQAPGPTSREAVDSSAGRARRDFHPKSGEASRGGTRMTGPGRGLRARTPLR